MLGTGVRHREHGSELDITETRVDSLEQLVLDHLNEGQLSAGAAGKLHGRFSATSPQSRGKWGRVKV